MKMPLPPGSRGKLGLIDWLSEFYWAWRVSRIIESEDIDLEETRDGTQILVSPGPPGRSLASGAAPFAVRMIVSGGASYRVAVALGHISGVVPKLDGKYLWADPAPTLDVSDAGDGSVLSVACDVGGGCVDQANIVCGDYDETDTLAKLTLGVFREVDGALSFEQIARTNYTYVAGAMYFGSENDRVVDHIFRPI